MHGSVPVPRTSSWLRRLIAFSGPAYLVSVGYMDPGNWATDLAGGSAFGYRLIWVLLVSNLMAVLLQTLAARLGVVTGKDLAQACRDYYPRFLLIPLWLLCEAAIAACDLAEVLGTAIGLHLLFGLPLLAGVIITAFDVLLFLGLSRMGMRRLEAFIVALVGIVALAFGVETLLSRPDLVAVFKAFLPRGEDGAVSLLGRDSGGRLTVLGLGGPSLYVALGILGATIMPHNLYLHSSLVQSRAVADSREARRQACRLNLIDTGIALNFAFLVNAAILVLAAAAFHASGHRDVRGLQDAHHLLAPLLGTGLASTLFALALICAGQASTITGTLAGQIVMEGFLRVRVRPWIRRMISRGLAVIPAALAVILFGDRSVEGLLVLSQVILSLQLAFAVVPLISFTSDRGKMGEFVNPPWVVALAVAAAVAITVLNGSLVIQQIGTWLSTPGPLAVWTRFLILPVLAGGVFVLLYISGAPLLKRLAPAVVRAWPARGLPFSRGTSPEVPPAAARVPAPTGTFQRIAVALEMGPADRAVLEHIQSLAHPAETELILLHVVESAASRFLGPESFDQESRQELAALEGLAVEFETRGFRAVVMLGHGDPKAELARLVSLVNADLLLTGSHGHGRLGDLVHGETVSGLRHRVRCPVLTIPGASRSRPGQEPTAGLPPPGRSTKV